VLARTSVWNKASRAQLSIVEFNNISTGEHHKESLFDCRPYSDLPVWFGGSALARHNAHSLEISDVVQIGDTKLKPGYYKVEWQGPALWYR